VREKACSQETALETLKKVRSSETEKQIQQKFRARLDARGKSSAIRGGCGAFFHGEASTERLEG
jgi:hypothetical protein